MKTAAKTYAKPPTKANSDLVCCRACLATEGKLYNMHEYNLVEAFARISGITVKVDRLPQHLCASCAALLRRCDAFKAKCARANLCLLPVLMNGKLTTEYIRTVDRYTYSLVDLKRTNVQTISCVEEPIKEKPRESAIDVDDIDLDNDNELEIKLNDDNIEREFDKENVDEIEESNKSVTGVSDNELVVQNGNNDSIVSSDTSINKSIGQEKVKKKHVKPVRRYRTAENDYMPHIDFDKFEKRYQVKVIILTKEQQLKEIEMHKSSPAYLEAEFKCEPCGKVFQVVEQYINHCVRHYPNAGQFVCEICSVRYSKNTEWMNHLDNHRFKFVCGQCGFVSQTRAKAMRHHDKHAGRTYECRHCGKRFISYDSYRRHVRGAHAHLAVACDMCGEIFVSQLGLANHKSRTHSVKNYTLICTTCSAQFMSSDALKRHAATCGAGAGLRPCARCGEGCASEELLQQHAAERHPRCEQCGTTFSDATSFATHALRMHTPSARAPHCRGCVVCEVCGKFLKNKSLLKLHKIFSHGAVRPFVCAECPKTFHSKTRRETHMRTHTGERPFQCADCPRAFALKRNLKRHILVIHMGIRAERTPCRICGKVLSTPGMMRMHVRTVHCGQPLPMRMPRQKKPAPLNTEENPSNQSNDKNCATK